MATSNHTGNDSDSYDYDASQRRHRAASRISRSTRQTNRRFMTAAVVIGGGTLAGGSALAAYSASQNTNVGRAFTQNGRQYYIPGDSKRALYPSKEACMKDVPWDRQVECEPKSNYSTSGGGGGYWYGPVYTPRDQYQPGSQYRSEEATSANTGKGSSVPKAANTSGFGSSGKALTGKSGGS